MTTSLKRKAGANIGGSDAKKPKPDSSITSFFGLPKAVASAAKPPNGGAATATTAFGAPPPPPAASETPAFKFNKDKWVAGLTADQQSLLQLEIDTLDPSWLALLKDDITTREFLELKRFLLKEAASGKRIFPPREDIYSWSRHTPFHNVKVVILGQDPYHNVNQAHGLAFSVRPPTPAPPSLKNMYKALARDYPAFRPPPRDGGLLTPWADRGVLMLNTCLTVRAHEANSHANRGWERFTQRVIDLVAARRTHGVVFMAWGTPAGKRVVKVDAQRHLVLRSVHPSPLSAMRGFFDCGHFKKANEWLVSRYGEDGFIDWSLTEGLSLKPVPEGEEEQARQKKEEEEARLAAEKAQAIAHVAFDDGDFDSDLETALDEAERHSLAAMSRHSGHSSAAEVRTAVGTQEAMDKAEVPNRLNGRSPRAKENREEDAARERERMARAGSRYSSDETEVDERVGAAVAAGNGVRDYRDGDGDETEEYDEDGSETETEFKEGEDNYEEDEDDDDDNDDDDYDDRRGPQYSFTTR